MGDPLLRQAGLAEGLHLDPMSCGIFLSVPGYPLLMAISGWALAALIPTSATVATPTSITTT